jgi:GntR family transcriptional regulator/MocR family aminotransferase
MVGWRCGRKVAPDIDVTEWLAAAEAAGVVFQAGEQFRWDGKPCQYARLGFAALREPELVEAVRRLVQSLPARQRRARARPAS